MSGHKNTVKPNDAIVGIDLGSTKVCAVIGQKTPQGIEIVGIGKHPSAGIKKGVVVNIAQTVDAIAKAVEAAENMAGCDIHAAVIGIAGSHIKGFNSTGVAAVGNQEVGVEDIRRALDAATSVALSLDREVIHVLPQDFKVNEQDGVRDPLGMSAHRLEARVHLVTGAASSAQNLVKCAERAGVKVSSVILEPLASAEAVLTADEKELGVAVVDIGGGTTDIAIYARGAVAYTSVIPIGGHHITNDIAVGLRTTLDSAEKIKLKHGAALTSRLEEDSTFDVVGIGGKTRQVSRSELTAIIEARVEEIFALVNKELAGSGMKHGCHAGVVVTGGTSVLPGLPELGEFVLECPTRRGAPQGIGGLLDVVSSPAYATAVGLLMYGGMNPLPTRPEPRETERLEAKASAYNEFVNRMKGWLGDVF